MFDFWSARARLRGGLFVAGDGSVSYTAEFV